MIALHMRDVDQGVDMGGAVRLLEGIAPHRTVVFWDRLGAEAKSQVVADARAEMAWRLSVDSAEMLSGLLARLSGVTFPSAMIRTGWSEFSRNPAPVVPVQLEVLMVFVPDPTGALQPNAVRTTAAMMLLDWFERLTTSHLDAAAVRFVRLCIMGLGSELDYELDIHTRTIVDGYGGDFQPEHRGSLVPRF